MQKLDLISDDYLKLQTDFHKDRQDYGIMGGHYVDDVMAMIQQAGCGTVLDYGCGKNQLADGLRAAGYAGTIRSYDPCIDAYSDMPIGKWDLVICTDVLEHIELDYLPNVLGHMHALCGKAFFFVIHTGPAKKVLPDGRNAHLIQRPPEWWLPQLQNPNWNISPLWHFDAIFYQQTHLHAAGRPA